MGKRILSMIIAVAFMLSAAALFAKTSTVDAKFILDKTKVSANDAVRTVNLTVLGLDKEKKVDLYGGQYGSTLYVVVTSNLGTVKYGKSTAPTLTAVANGTTSSGGFATNVKYVVMDQGIAKVAIVYPSTASGTDTLDVKLMELSAAGQYTLIASTSKTVTVESNVGKVKSLSLISKGNGSSNAGTAGDQIIYEAYGSGGSNLSGKCPSDTVTLDFLKSDLSAYKTLSTKLTDNGTNCVAIFIIDNTFTKAGKYYLEAKDGSVSSIGCNTTTAATVPTYTINPLSIPVALSLSTDSTYYVDNGSSGYDNITAKVCLLDKYGNVYDNSSESTLTIKIVGNGDYSTTISQDNKSCVSTTLDANTLASKKTTTIYATIANSTITNSDNVSLEKKDNKLVANTVAFSFDSNSMKLTGQIAIDNTSDGNFNSSTDKTDVGNITIDLYDTAKKKVVESVSTTTNSSGNFIAFFTKIPSSCKYIIKDGTNKPVVITTACPTKNYANIRTVKMVDALGRESSCNTVAAYDSTTKYSYYKFYPQTLAFYDANGNLITNNYSVLYNSIGFQVKASTLNALAINPKGFNQLSGATDNITITYDPTKVTSDNVTLSFYDNTTNLSSMTKTITVKGASGSFATLKLNIEQTTLPLNSTVAFSVEAFDSDGLPYNAKNIVMTIDDANGVGPTIKESGTTDRYNNYLWSTFGQRKFFTLSADKSGTFTLTFATADGKVSVSKQFTISSAYQEPVCSATSLDACKTETDCTGAGGYWYDNTCNATAQSTDNGTTTDNGTSTEATSAAPATALEASATAPATLTTVEATAGSTVSIKPQLKVASGDTPAHYYAAIVIGDVAYFLNGKTFSTTLGPVDSSLVSLADGVATFDIVESAKLDSSLAGSYKIYFGYDTGDNFAGLKFNGYTLTVK